MSLFDMPTNDFGLLRLGLGLMSAPGNFGQGLSRAGMGALDDMQNFEAQKQKRAMLDLQTQQMRAQMEEAQRAQKEREALQTYVGGLAPDAGMPADMQGPRRDPQQFDAFQAIGRGAGVAPSLQMAQLLQKQAPEMKSFKPGEVYGTVSPDGRFVKQGEVPLEQKDDAFIRLMRAAGVDPESPAGKELLKSKLQKDANPQPAVSLSFGSPMPAINPQTGEVELVRPDNKGGMAFTGIRPPAQNRDTKLPAEIQRMNIAADTMGKLLDDYEAMLKKYNPRDPMVQASPAVRAEFQSLMKGIQLQFKEVQALGALAGPDLALMEAAITDPFTVKGAFYGKDGLMSQIKQARNLLATRRTATDASQGKANGAPAPANDDPLGLRRP